MVYVFIFGGTEVSAEEERFDAFEKARVGRQNVFELPVLRAVLSHDDLAVVFKNLRFDFAWVLVHQRFERYLA